MKKKKTFPSLLREVLDQTPTKTNMINSLILHQHDQIFQSFFANMIKYLFVLYHDKIFVHQHVQIFNCTP